MEKPIVIAEIGCNHMGQFDTALEMIKIAAQFCKVDVVKFQKRSNRELLTSEEFSAPHPSQMHAFGETYGAHREFLEFDLDKHRELKACCAEWGCRYSSSVWDLTSAKEIASLGPDMLKVPSACNLDKELLIWLAEKYSGEIHVSLGMTTQREEDVIVSLFEQRGRGKDLVLYACTSGYPVPFEDICLFEVSRLKAKFADTVKAIGFSGHHLGIAADIAALALGAVCFERHFTLDRTWKGTDHAASLEPDGLRRLTRDLRNVSLGLKPKGQEILPIEAVQRKKLKRNVDV